VIERIVLEPAEDRISPAPKVLVLSNVGNVIFVSIEAQEETNKLRTTRTIMDKEAKEGEDDLSPPMRAELAVDAGDLEEAVKLLRHRERRFEQRLRIEKADEDRRKVEQPWRDLEGAVEKANYRAEKLHEKYSEEIVKSEQLAQEVVELQESLKAQRALVEQEVHKEVDLSNEVAEEVEIEEQSG